MPLESTRVRRAAGAAWLSAVLAGCASQAGAHSAPDDSIGVGALTAQCDSPVEVVPTPPPAVSETPAPSPSPPPEGFVAPDSVAPPGLVAAGYTVLWYLPGAPSGVLTTLRSLVTYLRRLDGFKAVVAAPGDPAMFGSRRNLVMDRMLGSTEVRQTCGEVSQDLVMRFMGLGPIASPPPTDDAPGRDA